MKQALVIIDVQNDYFPEGKFALVNTESTLKNVLKLQQYFRLKQLPIYYIQHIKSDPNANFFVKGSNGAEIHSSLLPIKDLREYIIEKNFPNSFYQTNLQQKLQQESIEQLVLCGMMSHMCVDSTTRYACELGYQPILIHNACTTRDLEFNDQILSAQMVHSGFMSALTGFASVISADAFIQMK
ncbi:cysteine hydrolase family protein [Gilliamella sp. WF3-4]|jgi:nicotinamidase-related amidase|uniref:cysteine hydrolase family protein n=1 Tax=Gilliamella sp. WF3-4 TaxID=3120255 RepID=UPI00080DDD9B|nr:cysteine hydrolase family protein [Gilliamella apicola]OCG19548.1 isochorismatase [Gilliamella apicola]